MELTIDKLPSPCLGRSSQKCKRDDSTLLNVSLERMIATVNCFAQRHKTRMEARLKTRTEYFSFAQYCSFFMKRQLILKQRRWIRSDINNMLRHLKIHIFGPLRMDRAPGQLTVVQRPRRRLGFWMPSFF